MLIKGKGLSHFFACLTVLFLGWIHAGSLQAAGANWSPPINVSHTNANSTGAQIAATPDGNTIAVWSEFVEGNYIIHASVTKLSGGWSSPVRVSKPDGDAFFPQIAIDTDGNAIAIWSKKSGKKHVIQTASKTFGKPWSNPVDIVKQDKRAQDAQFPQIIFDKSGDAHAVWQNFDGERNIILYAKKEEGKTKWSTPLSLSDSGMAGLGDIRPKIAVGPSESLIVAWINTEKLTAQASIKSGACGWWSNPEDLSDSGNQISDVQVALDRKGNAIAVWTRSDGTNMVVQTASRPISGQWSQAVDLSLAGEDALSPSLAINTAGNAIATWQRSDGVYSIVQVAKKPAKGNWSSPIDLTETGEDATIPRVAQGPSNAGVIVWKRSDGADFVIQASTSIQDSPWSVPVTLSSSGQDAVNPQLTVTSSGKAAVIWLRSNGTNTVVQSSSKSVAQ